MRGKEKWGKETTCFAERDVLVIAGSFWLRREKRVHSAALSSAGDDRGAWLTIDSRFGICFCFLVFFFVWMYSDFLAYEEGDFGGPSPGQGIKEVGHAFVGPG